MLKGKFAVLALVAAAVLCWQVAGVSNVNSGIVDKCASSAELRNGTGDTPVASGTTFGCQVGDGDILATNNLSILVTIIDNTAVAVPGIPAEDFWLIGCNDLLTLCDNTLSTNADGATNGLGQTFIRNTQIKVAGCDLGGVRVVCQGAVIDDATCPSPACVQLVVNSTDRVAPFLIVLNNDFTNFAGAYVANFGTDSPCEDHKVDHNVANTDFTKFASHYYENSVAGTGNHHCGQ
jgi:hypothetical protein